MRAPARRATLLLVRHPHTSANDGGGLRMNGWTDAPLSARGLVEAGLLLRRLSVEARTTAVYTSPSQRARAIADGLEELGFPRATIEPDLREIGCGPVDGWDVSAR